MPLYTPLSGSWLNMAESVQRIIVGRALAGQQPQTPRAIIQWLEETVAGWNTAPTPFVWGGKRRQRRQRARQRQLGGSGAILTQSQTIAVSPTSALELPLGAPPLHAQRQASPRRRLPGMRVRGSRKLQNEANW
jgi:hypothetical protein